MTRSLADDEALVGLCRRGDRKAFELLVARHSRYAGAVAVAVVRDYHTAMDVVQESFVKVLDRVHTLDDARRFRSWLRNIVRTTAIDQLRRRKVAGRSGGTLPGQDSDSAPLPDEGVMTPEDLMQKAELREEVRAEIARLPETQREVVVLKYLEGLSYEEIAAAMQVSVATVESRLFRARASLRERLVRRFGPQEGQRD